MGKHHRASRMAKAGIVPAATMALLAAGTGLASADPVELPSQGGVTTPAPSTQGGTTTAPTPPADPIYWTPPPAVQPEYKPLPNYDYGTGQYSGQTYAPPLDLSTLHAPVEVEQAPIYIAPPEKILVGDIHFNQPNWVTDEDRERTNNTAGLIRSDVATFWKSVGVDADRADRVAAAQITATTVGALSAGSACAVGGGLLGGTIGGIAGAGMATMVPLPPPLPQITSGVAGTAIGAGAGAALAAAPCAVAGGAAGLIAGTAFGAGDDEGQPIEVEIPDVGQETLTEQSTATLTSWESAGPVGESAAAATENAVATAPQIDSQVREWVKVQPGGEGVIAAVDNTLDTFFGGSAGTAAEMISTAIGDGVTQA